jgi:GNAT superfamily N-acetyltransferase
MAGVRSIRFATTPDIAALPLIERAADSLFEELLGPEPFGADSEITGAARAAEPGFILVAAEREDGPAVGFVHVLEVSGAPHLEQLAVLPQHLRRGHGRALVEAAVAESSARGHDRLTLRTFADIPWNRPFYEACGFAVIAPVDSNFHRGLVRVEEEMGLTRHGRRVLMARAISPEPIVPVRARPR